LIGNVVNAHRLIKQFGSIGVKSNKRFFASISAQYDSISHYWAAHGRVLTVENVYVSREANPIQRVSRACGECRIARR
jgi:hypothetical protein